MPFPNWLTGGFERARRAASKAYGNVDRAVFSGALPGGSDSPYVGRSVDPAKQRQAQQLLRDFTGATAVASTLERAAPLANRVLNTLRANPATQVPLSTIERVQQFVSPRLRTPVTVTGFINEPDAFFDSGNRVNIRPFLSDEARAQFNRDFETWNANKSSMFDEGRPRMIDYAKFSAPVALHEFGHALNFGDPGAAQKYRNLFYKQQLAPGRVAGLSIGTGQLTEDRPFWQAGLEGMFTNLVSPGTRHTIAEEALATKNAFKLAGELGLPKGRRMLGAALGTYALPPAGRGGLEGVLGELASRAADKTADLITDYVIDPALDRARGSDYTPLEQKLRQYGYDESEHRLRSEGGSGPVKIEFK